MESGEQECSPYMGNGNGKINDGGQECPPYTGGHPAQAKSKSRFLTSFRNDKLKFVSSGAKEAA